MTTEAKKLSAFIVARRKELKMPFLVLAKRLEMSKGNLWKIEQGQGNPCLSTLKKLTRVLKFKLVIWPSEPPVIDQGPLKL
jgi:transcriptional regulator with XRE-family HTH domain